MARVLAMRGAMALAMAARGAMAMVKLRRNRMSDQEIAREVVTQEKENPLTSIKGLGGCQTENRLTT